MRCLSMMPFACATILLGLMLASVGSAAPSDDPYVQDAASARAFCKSPASKKLSCGWASDAEQKATLSQCLWCGTVWQGPPSMSLPITLEGSPNYYQMAGRVVSLACQGRVVVRSVFKMLQQPKQDKSCAPAFLDSSNELATAKASPVIRCELQLPTGAGTEAERATRAKEVNCVTCTRCSNGGGCPSVTGRWYSDSFTTTVDGCASKFTDGYQAHIVPFGLNTGTKVQVAKWEVCNSPSCFNAQVEADKAKGAKKCVNRVC